MKRILKILLWIFFSLLTLMVLGVFLLSTESVQNILCQKTAAYLSKQLGTRIEVKHLRLSFFNKLNIEGVYVEDSRKDTLAYIGRLQVHTPELISLWWKGQKPEIRRLELEDAYIRLNRNKDSVWNYDFLNGSSTSTPSNRQPKTDTTNDKQGTDLPIHLKELVLRRVRFAMDDGWRGEDIDFAVQELSLHSDFSQFKNKKIHIPSLQIQGADILVREYDGNKPEDLSPDDTTSWGTPFNPAHWSVTASSLGITNSNFRYWNGNEKPLAGHFDEDKIEVSGIDLHLEQTRIQDDTLFSTLQSLKARERCGLEIKHMQAGIALSQVKAVLNNLNLETGHSVLKDRYEMHYRNFHDFNQYINKVRMVANLQNSQISTLDIGYFADILNEYPIAVNVTGYFEGTVDRLSGTRMDVQTLHTRFKGNARVTGLPDIEQTRMEVADIELSTSGKDLNALIPQTRTPAIAWNELTVLEYKGMYRGAIDTFYTKGNLVTSLGNASLDMNMNFRERVPRYAGHLETQEFQIGRFVHQQDIGAISMKGQIDGSGFSLNDLNTRVNAQIASFAFGKKEYHDLTINGLVEKKTFDGIFISKDPGLTFNFNGKVNLNGRVPEYNMNARFIAVDLQKAGITPQPMMASAFATLNFSGNTLDEFTGEASLRNLILQTSNQKFFLDSMQLTSVQEGEQKNLSLRSPLADASLQGRFTLSNLSQAVQVYLSHYLPQYIKLPTEFSNQELKYSVQLKNCDSILNLFYPDLHGLSGTYLSGELDTRLQRLSLDLNIPELGFRDFHLKDIVMVGAGDYSELDVNATFGNLLYNESVIIPSMQINSLMANDTAMFSLITQNINEVLGDAQMNLKAVAIDNSLHVRVLPSVFSLKEDNWQVYSNSDLIFGSTIRFHDLWFENGAQKLSLNTSDMESELLEVELHELDLGGIMAYMNVQEPALYGRLNGTIEVKGFDAQSVLHARVHTSNELRLANDTLGITFVDALYDMGKQRVQFLPGTIIRRQDAETALQGSIQLKDSLIDVRFTLDESPLDFAGQFISDYVTNVHGLASGSVTMKGSLREPAIGGKIKVQNGTFRVLYLGTGYHFNECELNFNNRTIDLLPFELLDEREGDYKAMVSGKIQHEAFRNFYFDMDVRSENLLCLNTQEWDNELFYGYVPASLQANVKGYLDDIALDIQSKPLKGSRFYMPIQSTGDASTYDYIHFVQLGRDQDEALNRHHNYFKLNLNVEATPDAQVFIILDKNTGEEIVAKGNGNINLGFDMGNSMNMFGTYAISEGKYLFNFRGVLPRTFVINEGSRIQWNGDPLAAKLDVTAVYKLEKQLSLYPLIAGKTTDPNEINEAKKRYETLVTLYLKNELSNPDITFDISQPLNKAVGTLAYDKLQQIKNDEKELVSQAGVLLLLGEFKSADGLGSAGYELGGVATASDLIGNALSSGLTNVFSEVTGLKNVSLSLGYNKTYSTDVTQSNLDQFNFGVSANLFKDRMVVDFGSNVDLDRNTNGRLNTNNLNVGGDLKAQYLITEDGRLRVNAFSSSNTNTEGNNITKGGLGISYKKVFNNIWELFGSRRKKKPESDSLKKS